MFTLVGKYQKDEVFIMFPAFHLTFVHTYEEKIGYSRLYHQPRPLKG